MEFEDQPELPQYSAGRTPQCVRLDRRIAAWLVVLVLFAACAGCLAVPFLYPLHFEALYGACAGALLTGGATLAAIEHARLVAVQVIVDERGLLVRLRGTVRAVRWEEMTRLRVRSTLQRLEVHVETGGAALRLPFALTGYDEIASLIVARVHTPTQPSDPTARLFRARFVDSATPVVAPIVVLLSIVIYDTVLIIAWLVAVAAVLYWLAGWIRIRVADDALVFVHPLGERRVPYSDVAHVTLSALEPRRSLRSTLLILHESGGVSMVSGPREGEHALHAALSAALESYRSARTATAAMVRDP